MCIFNNPELLKDEFVASLHHKFFVRLKCVLANEFESFRLMNVICSENLT